MFPASPRPVLADGDGVGALPPAVALPHATTPRLAMTPAAPRICRFIQVFLPAGCRRLGSFGPQRSDRREAGGARRGIDAEDQANSGRNYHGDDNGRRGDGEGDPT